MRAANHQKQAKAVKEAEACTVHDFICVVNLGPRAPETILLQHRVVEGRTEEESEKYGHYDRAAIEEARWNHEQYHFNTLVIISLQAFAQAPIDTGEARDPVPGLTPALLVSQLLQEVGRTFIGTVA